MLIWVILLCFSRSTVIWRLLSLSLSHHVMFNHDVCLIFLLVFLHTLSCPVPIHIFFFHWTKWSTDGLMGCRKWFIMIVVLLFDAETWETWIERGSFNKVGDGQWVYCKCLRCWWGRARKGWWCDDDADGWVCSASDRSCYERKQLYRVPCLGLYQRDRIGCTNRHLQQLIEKKRSSFTENKQIDTDWNWYRLGRPYPIIKRPDRRSHH